MSWNVIDISKYQTITDYQAVTSSVDGVIIKAGYRGYGSTGVLVTDTSFEDNYSGFVNKTKIGFYFTSTAISAGEAVEEANYIYNLIKSKECDFPVYIVSEYSNSDRDGRSDQLSKSERTEVCLAFCNRLKELGYNAGVQATDTWFNNNLNLSDLEQDNLSIWVTKYTSEPTYVTNYDGWRKNENYEVSGASTSVYLTEFVNNIANWGSEEEEEKTDINNFVISVEPGEATYTGEPLMPLIRVENLKPGVDYVVSYDNNINAGYGTAIITGINSYTGSATKSFLINPASFEDMGITITCNPREYEYTGEEIYPDYYMGELSEYIDYTTELSNNINVGIAIITATGIGNYIGTTSDTFNIIGTDINNFDISLEGDTYSYTGEAIEPEVIAENLTLNEDYEVLYQDNVNVGIGQAIVHGIGNYSGNKILYFTIVSSYIFGTVYIEPDTFVYTGHECIPNVRVAGISPTDYDVTFRNNINAGTAKAVIKGKNNLTGTRIETFTIEGRSITEFVMDEIPNQYYTGYEIKPEVTISGLIKDTDYTVRYEDNTTVGTATIKAYGIINYKDYIMNTFEILETPMSMVNITYDEVSDILTLKFQGHTLREFTDYIITEKHTEESSEGTVHVFTIQGCNGFSDSIIVRFTEDHQDIEEEFAPGTEFELVNVPVYPNYCSESTNNIKNGTFYIYKPQIVNNRIRITKDLESVGVPIRSTGWADIDDLRYSGKPRVGSKCEVNGKLMKYTNNSGSYIEIDGKDMYVIEVSDLSYPYPYAMAEKPNGIRVGWASTDILKLV